MATRLEPIGPENKHFLPPDERREAWRICQAYPKAKRELEEFSSQAIRYDKEHVMSSNTFDQTFEEVARREKFWRTVNIVENAVMICAPGVATWMLRSLCYGESYEQLRTRGIPMGINQFYEKRNEILHQIHLFVEARGV